MWRWRARWYCGVMMMKAAVIVVAIDLRVLRDSLACGARRGTGRAVRENAYRVTNGAAGLRYFMA
jgi:hypothetical protein